MKKSMTVTPGGNASKHLLLRSCLAVFLIFLFAATALADGPAQSTSDGSQECATCHPAETEAWQNSPHAKALISLEQVPDLTCNEGDENCQNCLECHTTDFDPAAGVFAYGGVTCQACHGPMVEGHPQQGVMQLTVDSSVCRDCHTETYNQWQQSLHAKVGVQCIGCHLSHSQEFRLTDEALCGSCHRDRLEDFAHTTHNMVDVSCVDCHVSAKPVQDAAAAIGGAAAPGHSFTVSSAACTDCHGQTIHEETVSIVKDQASNVRLLAMAERAPELATKLKTVEQDNRSLQTLAFVSLGLGLGTGGMMGIVSMLVVGYILQGRLKR